MTSLPHQRHSPTSRDAATLFERKAPTVRGDVFMHIRKCGAYGCTDAEGQAATGIDGNTWRPRRVELMRLGMVAEQGQRKGVNGRMAVVWVAKEETR